MFPFMGVNTLDLLLTPDSVAEFTFIAGHFTHLQKCIYGHI